MKRFVVLLAGMVAALSITAATAAADTVTYTLSLQTDLPAITWGGAVTLRVAILTNPTIADVGQYRVLISSYDDAQCTVGATDVGYLTTHQDGTFNAPIPLYGIRTYYFDATVISGDLAGLSSNCVAVKVYPLGPPGCVAAGTCGNTGGDQSATPAAPVLPSDTVSSSYLCWNREMVNPIAYIDKTADEMWATGKYFEPQAIFGNVEGGTNIGAYHLLCNAPSTMKITEYALGGSGEVYSPEAVAAYHKDHLPADGNDLNLYHIWK